MVSPRKIKSPRIVRRSNTARLFGVFFLGMLLGVVGWLGFDYGKEWAGFAAGEAGRTHKRLRSAVEELQAERDDLRRRLAVAERTAQIDREATLVARQDLRRSQEAAQVLRKDVEFFRSLAEGSAAGSLRINNFLLHAGTEEREYGYRFTIRQVKEDFGMSNGSILLAVEGVQHGDSRTLDVETVKMRFRHFQKIDGRIQLPTDFVPVGVLLEVKPESKKLAPLKQRFDWKVKG